MTRMVLEPFILLLLLSTALPSAVVPPDIHKLSPKAANQQLHCHVGSDAWPKLWLDVVLLIDTSAAQTHDNFVNMKEKIKEIWQPDSGGSTVGQGTAQTRVGVVTFSNQAQIVAELNQLNSNTDLINTLNSLSQTTATTVDGTNALRTAHSLIDVGAPGERSNAPNVIIIYTSAWDGNNACQIAQRIQNNRNTNIFAVTFNFPDRPPVNMPASIYSPGQLYDSANPSMDETLLESLSYANCICIGQQNPNSIRGTEQGNTDRAFDDHWIQFWLPQDDGKYYLQDKHRECLGPSTFALTHDSAQNQCHHDKTHLPTDFSPNKHQFLTSLARSNNILSQWLGLQCDKATNNCYWDNYDRITNQPTRILMDPSDFTAWNRNQPNVTNNKICVKDIPGTGGLVGFRWTSARCSVLSGERNFFYCEQPACDALNYCSNA